MQFRANDVASQSARDMGNKLCKKKVDNVDGEAKSQTPFDRIITRLHVSGLFVYVLTRPVMSCHWHNDDMVALLSRGYLC